ncbi:MAG: DNA-binding domain-containing protein [Chlamydiales bacterium]|nr:DNA-binding domain-containing protein [Chlamydiales bacterium]
MKCKSVEVLSAVTYHRTSSSPPKKLQEIQQWFASVITRPIDENSSMNKFSSCGKHIDSEAIEYILPSSTLSPGTRISIYHQQYWWRLLSALHDTFPLLTRLFGYREFNLTLAIPYLTKYPPNHWSMNFLGSMLSNWIAKEYLDNDKQLIEHACKVDWAYNCSFFAPKETEILASHMQLQTHTHLFELPYNLFQFREQFLLELPEYWIEHDFPLLERSTDQSSLYYVLYRDHKNYIVFEKISACEFKVLSYLKEAHSLDELSSWLEKHPDLELQKNAATSLHLWMRRWVLIGWLVFGTKALFE